MAECNHDFIGTALVLSAEQYKEYKNPQIKKTAGKPRQRKKVE